MAKRSKLFLRAMGSCFLILNWLASTHSASLAAPSLVFGSRRQLVRCNTFSLFTQNPPPISSDQVNTLAERPAPPLRPQNGPLPCRLRYCSSTSRMPGASGWASGGGSSGTIPGGTGGTGSTPSEGWPSGGDSSTMPGGTGGSGSTPTGESPIP